jgi:hypothetical protein
VCVNGASVAVEFRSPPGSLDWWQQAVQATVAQRFFQKNAQCFDASGDVARGCHVSLERVVVAIFPMSELRVKTLECLGLKDGGSLCRHLPVRRRRVPVSFGIVSLSLMGKLRLCLGALLALAWNDLSGLLSYTFDLAITAIGPCCQLAGGFPHHLLFGLALFIHKLGRKPVSSG